MAVTFTNGKMQWNGATTGLNTGIMTIMAFLRATGQGEGNAGVAFQGSESSVDPGIRLMHAAADNVLQFVVDFDTTDGIWTFPCNDNEWHHVAVTYDRTNLANDPIVYVDGELVTVTEVQAPTGTAIAIVSGYCIGSNSGATADWAGAIAQLLVYNRILTQAEVRSSMTVPGSLENSRQIWHPLWKPFGAELYGEISVTTNVNNNQTYIAGPSFAIAWAACSEIPFEVTGGGGDPGDPPAMPRGGLMMMGVGI